MTFRPKESSDGETLITLGIYGSRLGEQQKRKRLNPPTSNVFNAERQL